MSRELRIGQLLTFDRSTHTTRSKSRSSSGVAVKSMYKTGSFCISSNEFTLFAHTHTSRIPIESMRNCCSRVAKKWMDLYAGRDRHLRSGNTIWSGHAKLLYTGTERRRARRELLVSINLGAFETTRVETCISRCCTTPLLRQDKSGARARATQRLRALVVV